MPGRVGKGAVREGIVFPIGRGGGGAGSSEAVVPGRGRGGKGAVREGIVSLLGGGEGAQVAVRQLCRGEGGREQSGRV